MHQRMATLGRLLAGLAHEVNNPLTFLKGNVELLRGLLAELPGRWQRGGEGSCRETLKQAEGLLEDMAFGAIRIQDLVAAMRRFATPQQRDRRWVHLAVLMSNSLKLAQTKRTAGTATEVTLPPPETLVDADPVELETCLVNLLVNAYEAVPEEGSVVRYSATLLPYATGTYHGLVEVVVEDDGPGIPQAVLDEVFTPFFTRKQGGMGLGLSISYEAAKRNGAQLELHSQEGAGTRALLRLPYDVREASGDPGDASTQVLPRTGARSE
jgi:signal transduction histidine kinase